MNRKKHVIRTVILILMGVCMLSFLTGCGKKIRNLLEPITGGVEEKLLGITGSKATGMKIADDAEIQRLSYHYAATYIGGMYSYTFEKKDEGMELTVIYDCINDDDPQVVILSKEDENKLMEILRKYDVGAWDGFHMTNTNVLDGDGFAFNVVFTDGSTISASGSNCDPPNRGSVSRELNEMVEPYIYDFLVEKKIIYVEPVYYPVEYGVGTSYYYCDTYVSRLRTCHMTKEDEGKYPEAAAALNELNAYAKEHFSKTTSVLVDIIRFDTNIFSAALYEYDPQAADDNGKGVYGKIIDTVNIEMKSGRKLTYTDVLNSNRENEMRLIRNQIHSDYNIPFEELDPYMAEWVEDCTKLKFTIAPEWVTVYFNPGEIADEELGLIQAPSAYASKFGYNSSMFKHPASYTIQLCQPFKIFGYMTPDNRESFNDITLVLHTDQGMSDIYYICTEDKAAYLYSDATFLAAQDFPEDDVKAGEYSRTLYAYNLDNTDFSEIACYENSFAEGDVSLYDISGRESVGDGFLFRVAPTDSSAILIDGDGDYKKVLHTVSDNGELVEAE